MTVHMLGRDTQHNDTQQKTLGKMSLTATLSISDAQPYALLKVAF
jgi:hypothetical protein